MNQRKSQQTNQSGDISEQVRAALETIKELDLQLTGIQEDLTGIRAELTGLQEDLADALLELQVHQPPFPAEDSLGRGMQEAVAQAFPESVDIEKWLQDRDITIKNRRNQNPFDKSFDRLAIYLGRHFDSLRGLYGGLKKRAGGTPFPRSLSVKDLLPRQIGEVVQFGTDLHRNGFLKEFRYVKKERLLVFDLQEDGRVTNFFTGGWLERYVVLTASDYLSKRNPRNTIETLTNPSVLLPNGQDFELDIVIANASTVLWFECKTGKNYPAYVAKYGDVAKTFMQIDRKHAALVLLEKLTEEEKANNSQFSGMSVLNLPDLDSFLETLTEPDEGNGGNPYLQDGNLAAANAVSVPAASVPATPSTETASAGEPSKADFDASRLAAILRRSGLRPSEPVVRLCMIGGLVEQHQASGARCPLRILVDRLANEYEFQQSRISKSRINDMTTALIRAGCCERGSHPDYDNDVWFLRNDVSTEGACEACAKLYVWTLLKAIGPHDWNDRVACETERLVWGDSGRADEEHSRLDAAVEALLFCGQCSRQEIEGRSVILALGEQFIE